MKRFALCLFVLLLFFSALAHAQEELHWLSPTIGGNEAVMIVDNGSDWRTRLNLRSEPKKGSEIRGRIYTGTRVELYQDDGEWCTVGLNFGGGHVLTGDVMKEYLTPLTNGFSALCPLATAKTETAVMTSVDSAVAHLMPGDTAYVMAACSDRYFLLVPGAGQGYAPADAFEPLEEPGENVRIAYATLTVPHGGLTFTDEYTGEEVTIAGGVQLEDCWRIPGDEEWYVTFGAGIQRSPRVRGRIPQEKLSESRIPFEGEVYTYGKSFIACLGTVDGKSILRRTDEHGDIFWALGDVPQEAVRIDDGPYEIKSLK